MIEGQKVYKIDELISKLCSDIEDDYEREDKFLLRLFSSKEIIERGFCKKNIDDIIKSSSEDDIIAFYNFYVKDLIINTVLDGIQISIDASRMTVHNFIVEVMKSAVKGFINLQLSQFIYKLKGGGSNNALN